MRRGLLDAASLRQMLYDALDVSDDLLLVLEEIGDGADGLVIAATNDAFCRISGHAAADLIGKPFLALAAPQADPARCGVILQSAHDRQSFRSELLCSRVAGEPFWLGLHVMPVPRSNPACSVLLGRDITAVLQERQQHASIQGLLAKVFVTVQAAVAIIDEHGAILMVNPAFDRLLGYPVGSLLGSIALNLVAPAARPAILAARERQQATGQSYTAETTLLKAGGGEVEVALASSVVEREDLRRFRVITLSPQGPPAPAPLTIHVAGKIKLVSLEEIKSSLGERWPAVAARAMDSAEHIIKRRCGPRDTWSRTEDSGFIIGFGDVTEEEAALRATVIAREIRNRLIGEGEASGATYVSAITGTVELSESDSRFPEKLAEILDQRLSGRLAEIERRARETLREAARATACELSAVRSRRKGDIVGHFATLPRSLEHRVRSAVAALPPDDRQTFDFDRLVLGVAAGQVVEKLATGSLLPVFVSVEFEIFLDRRCTERYVAACQALDERLRHHLILVLSRLPVGVPRSRVLDCVSRLRPFCHMVACDSEGLHLPAIELAHVGVSIVVMLEDDLNTWTHADLARLERLVGQVRMQRAQLLVRNVSSLDNAKRLQELGVDLVAMREDRGHPARR